MVFKRRRSVTLWLMLAAVSIMIITFEANPQQRPQIPEKRRLGQPKCDPEEYVSMDLTGTYSGTVEQDGLGTSGVLEIKGKEFTLKVAFSTLKGSLDATWKCGVTEVLLKADEGYSIAKGEKEILVIAKKCEKGLRLESVKEGLSVAFTESNAARDKCRPYCPRQPCPKSEP